MVQAADLKPSADVIPEITIISTRSLPPAQTTSTTSSTADLSEGAEEARTEEANGDEISGDSSSYTIATSTPLPSSPSPSPSPQRKTAKKPKQARKQASSKTVAEMPPLQPIPLLICSIGNPGAQYANTLHSAGHNVIASLATYLSATPFIKDRAFANGAVSHASFSSAQPLWTLYQSPAFMNESGKPIAKAYQAWNKSLEPGSQGKLVILHDELEKPLGAVSVREGQGLSARGHNGIKSLLQHMKTVPFVRVGVGIGRPVSREPNDVAKFVLKKMTPGERERVEGAAGEVMARLRVMSGG